MSYDVIVIKQRNLLQPSNQVVADLLNHSSFRDQFTADLIS